MSIEFELQNLQSEHRRDLENRPVRERLRQLYLRAGREIPQSLARRSVNLDQLIAALESGGRGAGLNDLVSQGLSARNAWLFLNELLTDSDFPGRSERLYFCHVYAIGPYSSEALPLLTYDPEYYADLKTGDEFSHLLIETMDRSNTWLLLRAFGEDFTKPHSQELNPAKLCMETLEQAVEDYELENLNLALRLGFKLYFYEET